MIVGWSTPQITNIKADHVTLVLEHASPRTKIQLLRYQNPEALPDDHIRDLHKIGMNRICWTANPHLTRASRLTTYFWWLDHTQSPSPLCAFPSTKEK